LAWPIKAATTTSDGSSRAASTLTVELASGAALLDVDVVRSNLVRIGSNGGLEASNGGKFNKGAVLYDYQ